jgi:hypothetical protein
VAVGSSFRSGNHAQIGLERLSGRSNAVLLVVPSNGFEDVVRLVTGGFVARLALGLDAIDDMHLAIQVIARSIPVDGGQLRISLTSDSDWITVAVGAFEPGSAEQRLTTVVHDGLGLSALLERLVESIEIVAGPTSTIVMRKRLEEMPA